MEREWDMSEVSDGKLYSSNDLAKIGCNDCKGCSACCHDMGQSIVLDPYDIYRFTIEGRYSINELLATSVELCVVEGLILPILKMQEESNACFYLNEEGRCSIHQYRPGICRMFPLGRIYENGTFHYFLQIHECKAEQRTKVKIKQWLDTPDCKRYESFICDWHYLVKEYQKQAMSGELQGEALKGINMRLLSMFYLTPYAREQDFYLQYEDRKRLFLSQSV